MKNLGLILILLFPFSAFGLEIETSEVEKIVEVIEGDFEEATGYDLDFDLFVQEYDRRGAASHHHIVIDPTKMESRGELLGVVVHEISHVLVDAMNTWRKRDTQFLEFGEKSYSYDNPILDYFRISRVGEIDRMEGTDIDDFASGYGMEANNHEDRAEAVSLRLLHRDVFIQKALESDHMMQKFIFIHNLFNGWYYLDGDASMADEYFYDVSLLNE